MITFVHLQICINYRDWFTMGCFKRSHDVPRLTFVGPGYASVAMWKKKKYCDRRRFSKSGENKLIFSVINLIWFLSNKILQGVAFFFHTTVHKKFDIPSIHCYDCFEKCYLSQIPGSLIQKSPWFRHPNFPSTEWRHCKQSRRISCRPTIVRGGVHSHTKVGVIESLR